MSDLYLGNLVVILFCIVMAFNILFRLADGMHPSKDKLTLERMIIVYLIMVGTDIIWYLKADGFTNIPNTLIAIDISAMLCMTVIGCYFWYEFVRGRIGYRYHFAWTKYLIQIIVLFVCVMNLISAWTGWVFYILPGGGFDDGSLYLIQAFGCFFYILLAMAHIAIEIFRAKDKKRRKEFILYFCFMILGIITSFLEDILWQVPILDLSILVMIQVLFDTIYLDQEYDIAIKERELTESRTALMITQIQPHFIYNVLSLIKVLCRKDPEEAAHTTEEFSNYLRGNMDALNSSHLVPFDQELQHTQLYIKLEKRRFLDRLQVNYNIETTSFLIPVLSLQPIVENSVKHGVLAREEGGTINITAKETADGYEITVKDDGVGFDPKAVAADHKNHIGIANVRERLEVMCGGTLKIESIPDVGTTAVITLPKNNEDK